MGAPSRASVPPRRLGYTPGSPRLSEASDILEEIRAIVSGPQISAVEEQVRALRDALKGVDLRPAENEATLKRVAALAERLKSLEAKTVETLDRWQQDWKHRLAELEARVDTRLDALASQVEAVAGAQRRSTEAQRGTHAALEHSLASLDTALRRELTDVREAMTIKDPNVPESLPTDWLAALQRTEAVAEDLTQEVRARVATLHEELVELRCARDGAAGDIVLERERAAAARARLRAEIRALREELRLLDGPGRPPITPPTGEGAA